MFRPTQGHFTYMETSPIAGEGLQILTYTRHLWPLSSEGSLTCHIYCDTGHRFLLSSRSTLFIFHYVGYLIPVFSATRFYDSSDFDHYSALMAIEQ